ncbi:MAG: GTP-binding protein [Ruminococcaceae bacterium]|nr:GTP-binding protein [Oscillospiraceae bacterium]
MTKVNIISGFLGAGKTTFIKRLVGEVFKGEKLVLIENEFGEIGVDGQFLQEAGIEITEMNSGCICCSLVGDFTKALKEVADTYCPDRIIIEPSGVGKLSDVIKAVENADDGEMTVDSCITVADCTKCKIYSKNFGEFYEDQIHHCDCILLTRTDKADEAKIRQATEIIRGINDTASIITTPLAELDKEQILKAFDKDRMEKDLMEETAEAHHEHHHDEHCGCHNHEHHHHDEHCGCHNHEHHHHDEHCGCHNHEHHHDEHCGCHDHEHHHDEHCGCHDHEHHHHHADETFSSWGFETATKYTAREIEDKLHKLDTEAYGTVLRAKGMLPSADGWIYFDYVPGEYDIRGGSPCYTGKVCVIGAELNEEKLAQLFDRK